MALLAQREREVRRERGGAHAALGAGHGDDLAGLAAGAGLLQLGARRGDRVLHVGQLERLRDEVVDALPDEAAHALSREIPGGGQDGGAAAALLDDLAEMAELPLVVGVDVDQQDVHALERATSSPLTLCRIADARLGAHAVQRGEHGVDPLAELGRSGHRQDIEGAGTDHWILPTMR